MTTVIREQREHELKEIEKKTDEFAERAAEVVMHLGKDDPISVMYTKCLNAVLAVFQCADELSSVKIDTFSGCAQCMQLLDICFENMLPDNLDMLSSKREMRAAKRRAEKQQKRIKKQVESIWADVEIVISTTIGGIPTDLGEKRIAEIIASKQ